MTTDRRLARIQDAMTQYAAGRLSRRGFLRTLGALGLGAASATMLARSAAASSTSSAPSHGAHGVPAAQEGGPPAATPVLGDRPDGSRVWRVIAGGGIPEELIDTVAFYPEEITINAGDAIFFEIRGFHNVHFLSGQELPPLVVPDSAGGTPAAGQPQLILNPAVIFPTGGSTYDGTGVVNSGAPLDPTAPPFVLTFTQPGSYEYWCTIHTPVMKARVVVQEAGASYPAEQADYDRMAAERLAEQIEQTRQRIARYSTPATPTAGAANVHEVTAGFVEDQVDVLAFLPPVVTVQAGDTVRWTVRSAPVTPHIVTFLGDQEPLEFLVPEMTGGGPPTFVLNPQLIAPAGGQTFTAGEFFNSGLLGAGPDAPTTYELTFDTPGTYRYYCPIHGDPSGGMIGEVVVE